MTPFQKKMAAIQSHLAAGRFVETLSIIAEAHQENPSSSLCYSYEGTALWKLGRTEEAKTSFTKGLDLHPQHYPCMMGLFDLLLSTRKFVEAHELGKQIASSHTLPLKRIPDFIRLSVQVLDMKQIVDFYQAATSLSQPDGQLATYMAAGLTVAGMYLLKHDQKTALDAFKKAEMISKGRPTIYERIIVSLLSAGLEEEVKVFLVRAPDYVRSSPEVEVAQLELYLRKNADQQALALALDLLKRKVHRVTIYRSAIELSIKTGRKRAIIEDLIDAAMNLFPDEAETFNAYRERI